MAHFASNTQVSRYRLTMSGLVQFALILLAVFLLIPSVHSQNIPKKAKKFFNEANYDIGLNRFDTAEEKLLLAIKVYPGYERARIYLADIYYQTEEYSKAVEAYTWVRTNGNPPVRVALFLAKSHFELQQYDQVIELVQEYLDNERISPRSRNDAERLLANAEFSREAIEDPVEFDPQNLGPAVNSSDHEYLPVLSADESTVVFTRKIRGQEDLYRTGMDGDSWKEAEPLEEDVINTAHNEGAHCISADGKTLLMTICNERTTIGSCDLYLARKLRDGWTQPVNLGPKLNSVSWDSQPTLSADGKSIYFISNRAGGYGGKDIWVSHFRRGKWMDPVNLGPVINTPFDEQTPSIHFDNQTLYFSSEGHPGFGRQDIFFSRLVDGNWQNPVNLGYPINTSGSESGLSVSLQGEIAYFSAEREDGFGSMDIYSFELPEEARPQRVTYVKAIIRDKETGKPVNATFQLKNLDDPSASIVQTAVDGEILVCLPSGSDYSLHIKQDDYAFESFHFSLKDTVERKPFILDVQVETIKTGTNVVLQNVFFETDSYELHPASFSELEELTKLMQDNPDIRIEISGHTDNTGDHAYNIQLSAARAQSVVDHLVSNGIDAHRLIAVGYGPDRPVASNASAEGRALNRRTEFTVIE